MAPQSQPISAEKDKAGRDGEIQPPEAAVQLDSQQLPQTRDPWRISNFRAIKDPPPAGLPSCCRLLSSQREARRATEAQAVRV